MSTTAVPGRTARAVSPILVLYAATLFLSAFVLFSVQPMFTKMLLPRVGGSPAVWNTAVVFFQAALQLGYLYAHLSTKFLGLKKQTILHAVVLLVAAISLPIGIEAGSYPPNGESPIPWLLGVLTLSVGLPFFAVSATAPLLQKWFSHTDDAWAGDPYFLYGASNIGSLLALLAYPVFIERELGLRDQGYAWAGAYALLVLAIGTCGVVLWKRYRDQPAQEVGGEETSLVSDITPGLRLRWLLLSLTPSALLMGTTLHIGTDIAAAPFLWVLPLSLYLLTFVFVFARRPLLRQSWMLPVQVVVVSVVAAFFSTSEIYVLLVLHLAGLFVTAMVCHGELARLRPRASHLTEFYFWMSLGGVMGGFLAAIVAPVIFNGVYEYPIALLIALLLRPMPAVASDRLYRWLGKIPALNRVGASVLESFPVIARNRLHLWALDLALPAVLWFLLSENHMSRAINSVVTSFGEEFGTLTAKNVTSAIFTLLLLAFLILLGRRPLRFALGIGVTLSVLTPAVLGLDIGKGSDRLERVRTFFGVYTVYRNSVGLSGTEFHYITHGNTIHGVEYMDLPMLPVSYYTQQGPVGRFFQTFSAAPYPYPARRISVLGLGIGGFACYMRPDQQLTYFEIDPEVERLARTPEYFKYMELCGKNLTTKIGDGRLEMLAEKDASFDVIVLDAFSGDGIPVHLLTREAIQIYLKKLAPHGKILVHITNTFVDLLPVVSRLALDANLAALHVEYQPYPATFFALPTNWVVMARDPADIAALTEGDAPWMPTQPDKKARVWSDDYSDVFAALRWGNLGLFPEGVQVVTSVKIEIAAPAAPDAPAAPEAPAAPPVPK